MRKSGTATNFLQPGHGKISGCPRFLAFTLVELLIASVMIAVLVVGLGAHLRGGVTVWRRAAASGEAVQRRHVALSRLSRELANAAIYDTRESSYGEEAGTLPRPRFDEAALAWFTVLPPTSRRPLPAVRFVTYRCEERGGVRGLWRTSQSLGESRARFSPAPELILSGCEQMILRYAQLPPDATAPLEWRDRWEQPERALPRLVEVTLDLGAGGEVARRMSLPTGSAVSPGPPPS
ncbi:MAG: hypothetical protein HYT90_03110 [Candidatus Omnitrophica bacterium]|nr:hypothetical protein [Candidatus Omnitrophota bacterium]